MKVKNKVIAVTGGGGGIGRELVLNLLSRGAKVVAIDINLNGLKETEDLAQPFKDNFYKIVADITDRDVINLIPEQIINHMGNIDGLINNAGIMHKFQSFNDLEETDLQRVIDINLIATINLTRIFLPYLLKRPEGHIVSMSSMAGFIPIVGQSVYGATKAAVKIFTETLAIELTSTNVSVTVVKPGNITTNITKNAGINIPKEIEAKQNSANSTSPSKAAAVIINAIENKKRSLLVGNDAIFLDKLYRLLPEFATALIYKQVKVLLK